MRRNAALEMLRIFCCYCIIMLHASGYIPMDTNFWRFVSAIVRPCLWCFMALSGWFILSGDIEDWKSFYYKHLLRLVIPLIAYVIVYQLCYSRGTVISIKAIVAGEAPTHTWYVYTMIAMYLLAPFLNVMVKNLSKTRLTVFLCIIFFCGRVVNILALCGITINIPKEILGDCAFFYFLFGYWLYLMRGELLKHFKIIFVIGFGNMFYGAYSFVNPYLVDGAATLSLCMVIGVIFYFVLFQKIFDGARWKKELQKIVSFVSARTYGIFLIHMLILEYIVGENIFVVDILSVSKYYVLPLQCLLIFVAGLVISIPMDMLICNPLMKLSEILYQSVKRLIRSKLENAQ